MQIPGGTARTPSVLVLNGGSSSGKSTLALSLQEALDGYWLRLGVDTLIDAAPTRLLTDGGLDLADDGTVGVGPAFAELEEHWRTGVAAMARSGALVLVEDNWLNGPAAQLRWRQALGDLPVAWVGVRCAPEIAAARERSRGDRVAGMAARQAETVHEGVDYDLEVDTGSSAPEALAGIVRRHFFDRH